MVTEEILIDAFTALLVRQPEIYDVAVTTTFMVTRCLNWHRAIWVARLAGSINANADRLVWPRLAWFGPDIAGKILNPTSLILSLAMMLKWL